MRLSCTYRDANGNDALDPVWQSEYVWRSRQGTALGAKTSGPSTACTLAADAIVWLGPMGQLSSVVHEQKNPFAPEVPCHRVVAASLDLGGFKGVDTVPSNQIFIAVTCYEH